MGSGNMSHCRPPSLKNHVDHYFVVSKHTQQSFLARRIDVWGNKINIVQIIDHSMRLLSFLNCVRCWTNFTLIRTQILTVLYYSDSLFPRTATIRSINQVRGYNPISILHPRKWFVILLNCAKLKFVSHTSKWLEQTYEFLKTQNVPPDVDFEPSRSHAKSESWNTPSLHCLAMFPT